MSRLQGLGLGSLRSDFPSQRIVGVVAIEKWFVMGSGRGTILEAGIGSKLLPIDLLMHWLAIATGSEESDIYVQLASSQSIPRLWRQPSRRLQ